MERFFDNIFSSIGINDIFDILIISFIVYKILGFIQETRAQQLVKGLLMLVAAFFLSDVLNLYALNWILRQTMTLGVIALVVVFQPELRRGLEYVGRSKIVKAPFGQLDRETSLTDIAETGTVIEADISAQLLGNIFYEGAPLHDGAVIIRGDQIFAAGCVLPLTENKDLNKSLGTRHRAGIGITENSDAIAMIVSEETGIISMAIDGKLTRFLDTKTVEKTLLNLYITDSDDNSFKFSRIFEKIGGRKDAK